MSIQENPFLEMSPAVIDVLDGMVTEWLDRDRHAELDYGPNKTEALSLIALQVREAWKARVNYRDVEGRSHDTR